MSATTAKKRKSRKGVSINIPNWQDRLTSLTRLLRDKSETHRAHLRLNSSVEDIVHAAVTELETKKEQLRSLESQLQQLQTRAVATTSNNNNNNNDDHKRLNSYEDSSSVSSGSSSSDSPQSPFTDTSYNALVSTDRSPPRPQQTITVAFPMCYPPRSILHRDGFHNAPLPFFTMTAALLIVDCNDAFVNGLFRFGVPPGWNTALCSRDAILKNNITLVDIVSAFCSSKLKDLSQGIVATMMAGHVIVRDDRVVCHNGAEAVTDSSLWTTYDESDEFRRPLYVNCLQLSSRLLTAPPDYEQCAASVI